MRDVAYIALGSNLGDRQGHLARARAALAALPSSRVIAESSIEETEPLGRLVQPYYLNQMLALETSLSPHELLEHLQVIEHHEGRTRHERWGSRTLDLDIVCFEHQSVQTEALRIPHPGLESRRFWQRELHELRDLRELRDTAAPEREP
jgi:2-amino-4-hydroxy-6-hydroxymethyldihydropteridine diphosphokinase